MAEVSEPLGATEVRDRSWSILARIERNGSEHFEIDTQALTATAAMIAERHSTILPPLANGWWCLQEKAPATLNELAERLARADVAERSRTGFDLAMVWALERAANGELDVEKTTRSLLEGRFAGDGASPRLDRAGLEKITEPPLESLAEPLATSMEALAGMFGEEARFGAILERVPDEVDVAALYDLLAPLCRPVFTSGVLFAGEPMGDVWRMEQVAASAHHPGLVPFHAALQQLILDLVEPLLESGIELEGVEQLTAPAHRGLLDDVLATGLVVPKHAAVTRLAHPPGSDIVVELRCLATALVDRLADRVRGHLDVAVERLPPARMTGPLATLAKERRDAAAKDRAPPRIAITGSVF